MKALASALVSNGTAFYNLVMSGGSSSGMLIDLHPLSRGTVNIDPANPNREPLVDYRVLSNPLDPLIMADILRYTRKYHLDNPLTKSFGATEFAPGREVTTDEQFADYLVESINPSYFHPVGTCAMMPRELGGVVDEELRVYGTKGLRVVDASVMSTIVGANTCQTTYAVAEKVSTCYPVVRVVLTCVGCGFDQGGVEGGVGM
jgi:choline dehydrogenase